MCTFDRLTTSLLHVCGLMQHFGGSASSCLQHRYIALAPGLPTVQTAKRPGAPEHGASTRRPWASESPEESAYLA
ncbi:hypothetical protein LTR16_001289 [Cryomyces antarcticus]|uniref:Secreted protein n=1 Tax=Cryomyces antarcticus TaxID=329879 RepID=A0ABR0LQE6_9PEZI|nr:hypothetical protein LTR16_001289 [Cryomyces antarcticus]